jgi:Trk K+ transport system NAD-binding subunit
MAGAPPGGWGAETAEVTLAPSSPAADREVVELGFPRDATVVAVLREDKVVVPHGDTILRVGDEVMVLITDESEAAVRRLLVGGD